MPLTPDINANTVDGRSTGVFEGLQALGHNHMPFFVLSDATTSELASGRDASSRRLPWPILASVSLLALAVLPLLVIHARNLWHRSHYQFFPIVPLGAAVLALAACRRLGPIVPGSRRRVALLIVVSWTLLAIAILFFSPSLGGVATLAMLGAGAYGIGGGRLLRPLIPAWTFLGLIIPPPFGLDWKLVTLLQSITAHAGSLVLDTLGVLHVMEGHVVRVPGREFMVEEACSGIHSLYVVLASTLFFVLWARRPLARAVLLILSGFAWVMLGNIARVVTVTYVGTRWGIDVGEGWRHEALSLLFFISSLGLLVSTDCLLSFLSSSVRSWRTRATQRRLMKLTNEPARNVAPAARPAPEDAGPTRLPDWGVTWLASWPVVAAFAFLGLVQVALLWPTISGVKLFEVLATSPIVARFHVAKADDLPAQRGPFRLEAFEPTSRGVASSLGEFSRTWRYRFGGYSALLSVDYPFGEWHELPECYTSRGSKMLGRRVLVIQDRAAGEAGGLPVVEASLANPPGRNGYLLFGNFDQRNTPLEPPGNTIAHIARRRMVPGLAPWNLTGRIGGSILPSYQVQLYVESEYPLTRAEQEQALDFFRYACPIIRRLGNGAERGKS